jgi:hypothetical protein
MRLELFVRVSAAAGFVDLGDNTVGFSRATAVMHENLRHASIGNKDIEAIADDVAG